MFALTTTHLRFVCEATTPLRLEVENFRAGQNLRGALGQVMTRTYCAETLTPNPSPVVTREGRNAAHAATCPVHWLLAANEKPGQDRRGYALVPPMSEPASGLQPGEQFEFGITLFGHALKFLPYFVLAVPEMGRGGVGAGRGKFALKSVWAENPFTRERECLLAEGANLVHTPTLTMGHPQVQGEAVRMMQTLAKREGQLAIQFVTPTRLIEDSKLAQMSAFDVLFARMLKRLDEVGEQFGDSEKRGMDAAQSLQRIAERVRLVESQTRWVEVWSGSNRRGTSSPLSGIVGRAVYAASLDVWEPLAPWLLWGQLAQVGKSAVKGNGVILISDL